MTHQSCAEWRGTLRPPHGQVSLRPCRARAKDQLIVSIPDEDSLFGRRADEESISPRKRTSEGACHSRKSHSSFPAQTKSYLFIFVICSGTLRRRNCWTRRSIPAKRKKEKNKEIYNSQWHVLVNWRGICRGTSDVSHTMSWLTSQWHV